MRLLLAVSAAALMTIGCGSGDSKFVAQGKKTKKAMCACKDAKCAYEVDMKRREESKKFKISDLKDMKESDMKTLGKLQEEYKKCQKEIMKKDGKNHPIVKKMQAIADEVCKCADKDCAKKAREKANDKGMWVSGVSEHTRPIRKKMSKCYMDLLMKRPAKAPAPAPKKDDAKKK